MDLNIVSHNPFRATVTFAPSDPCFHGHFPGNPVTPGSVIMALCLRCLEDAHGDLTIRRFSFPHFATPGTYELRISQNGTRYDCVLLQGEVVFAQGRIEHDSDSPL